MTSITINHNVRIIDQRAKGRGRPSAQVVGLSPTLTEHINQLIASNLQLVIVITSDTTCSISCVDVYESKRKLHAVG